ncbi:MAG TPA: hypothetical protein VK034_32135 [Enhygromyxa sp.]|nr:hypothetical protein [Enhygromyxa sp.]
MLSSACLNPGSDRGPEHDGGIDGIDSAGECSGDAREPNDLPETAIDLRWDSIVALDGQQEAALMIDASLCSGDHDWYLLPVAELGFDFHVVRIDGLVRGASWCGQFDGCDGEVLPDAPENTLVVEVYDAASMVLLAADLATNGRVDVDGWGATFSKDLVIHVYGPSNVASYAYELHVDVRSRDSEDECQC